MSRLQPSHLRIRRSGLPDLRVTAVLLCLGIAACSTRSDTVNTTTSLDTAMAAQPETAASSSEDAVPESSAARGDTSKTMSAPTSMAALWDRIEAQAKALGTSVAARRFTEAKDRANNLGDLVSVYAGRVKAPPDKAAALEALTEEMSKDVAGLRDAADKKDAGGITRQYDRIRSVLSQIAQLVRSIS